MKKIGIILFALIIIYFIFLIRQDIIDNLDLRREASRVEEAKKNEEMAEVRFTKRLGELKRGDYIESLARVRLGWIKKGESAYKVINTEH